MKIALVGWIGYQRRSDLLARRLGTKAHFVFDERLDKPLLLPVRYVAQAQQTWRILRQKQPEVVIAQNPPVFTALVADLYAQRYGARYVIDSHTGAFLSRKWRWSLGLQARLSHRAMTTIVTNQSLADIVRSWGGHVTVLTDAVKRDVNSQEFEFSDKFNVAVVCSFREDEPIEVVFKAASRLPEASFYFTGDYSRVQRSLLAHKPDNCHLTGYLPEAEYWGLLEGSHAVMVLTTRDHTLLAGAYEALTVETPLILSDWPVLRKHFPMGTVHVANTEEGVCEGVRAVQNNYAQLKQEVQLLGKQADLQSDEQIEHLKHMLRAG
jgi:glycosyltransferase involved in cell wall biosynthesis